MNRPLSIMKQHKYPPCYPSRVMMIHERNSKERMNIFLISKGREDGTKFWMLPKGYMQRATECIHGKEK